MNKETCSTQQARFSLSRSFNWMKLKMTKHIVSHNSFNSLLYIFYAIIESIMYNTFLPVSRTNAESKWDWAREKESLVSNMNVFCSGFLSHHYYTHSMVKNWYQAAHTNIVLKTLNDEHDWGKCVWNHSKLKHFYEEKKNNFRFRFEWMVFHSSFNCTLRNVHSLMSRFTSLSQHIIILSMPLLSWRHSFQNHDKM